MEEGPIEPLFELEDIAWETCDHSISTMPLTSLPAEIIQKIAGECLFDDIVSLSHVCHRLREICRDPTIYILSFVNHV